MQQNLQPLVRKIMFWKKKLRQFSIYVADPYPVSIRVSSEDDGRCVMDIEHYELHEVIGLMEAAIDTKNKHYVKNYFFDDSITINEMRAILPLLRQAVYTAKAKGVAV